MTAALAAKDVTFTSLNAIDDGDGAARYAADGKPTIPAVTFDGDVVSFQHPSQLASLLQLDIGDAQPATAVAFSLLDVLERWVMVLDGVPFEALLEPTLSRGRNIRNLTVNVYRPIRMLPQTYADGLFNWFTNEADLQQESFLRDTSQVIAFAQEIYGEFANFLLEHGEELAERDPALTGNRGDMRFSELLVTQRFHAAFHSRQIVDFFNTGGYGPKPPLPEMIVQEIGLPQNLY